MRRGWQLNEKNARSGRAKSAFNALVGATPLQSSWIQRCACQRTCIADQRSTLVGAPVVNILQSCLRTEQEHYRRSFLPARRKVRSGHCPRLWADEYFCRVQHRHLHCASYLRSTLLPLAFSSRRSRLALCCQAQLISTKCSSTDHSRAHAIVSYLILNASLSWTLSCKDGCVLASSTAKNALWLLRRGRQKRCRGVTHRAAKRVMLGPQPCVAGMVPWRPFMAEKERVLRL